MNRKQESRKGTLGRDPANRRPSLGGKGDGGHQGGLTTAASSRHRLCYLDLSQRKDDRVTRKPKGGKVRPGEAARVRLIKECGIKMGKGTEEELQKQLSQRRRKYFFLLFLKKSHWKLTKRSNEPRDLLSAGEKPRIRISTQLATSGREGVVKSAAQKFL